MKLSIVMKVSITRASCLNILVIANHPEKNDNNSNQQLTNNEV